MGNSSLYDSLFKGSNLITPKSEIKVSKSLTGLREECQSRN